MKASCAILSIVIIVAIIAVVCMVKFATEITVEERKMELEHAGLQKYSKLLGVISLNEKQSVTAADRFPYVAAIMKIDKSSWSFSCFGSIILTKWVLTAAHCRKHGVSHRVLLYYDFVRNLTLTYPVLIWRLHEKYDASDTRSTPMYDIAVAKVEMPPLVSRPSLFDGTAAWKVEASVWKTVSTMDNQMYLTNDFQLFAVDIADYDLCYENYGVELNSSMICIDMTRYPDCFVTEFGPIYSIDRVVGLLAVRPRDCDTRVAIFTNVSFYSDWIVKTTHIYN